jgi:flagellar hook protein FlgE
MIRDIQPARSPWVQLRLAADNGLVLPSDERVYGWAAGKDQTGEPRALTLPSGFLDAAATTLVDYACNLPLPLPQDETGLTAALDENGMVCTEITRSLEEEFLALSLPGGQTAIFDGKGQRRLLKFRWVRVSSVPGIGTLWRCYVQHGQHYKASRWQAMEPLYFFDGQSGECQIIGAEDAALDIEEGWRIRFLNGLPQLTQVRCASNRVKVTRFHANGGAARELETIKLCPKGTVTAFFSDGRRELIGKAAPKRSRFRRAA